MSNNISIEQLASTIAEDLKNYSEEVTEKVKIGTEKVAKEVNDTIKGHITFNQKTGKYVRAFRVKAVREDRYGKTYVWYVAAPHYRLTHLLEKGHAKIGGGRTRAYPHIKYGEEIAKQRMEEVVREAIESSD